MLTAALFSPDFKIVVYIYEVFKLLGLHFLDLRPHLLLDSTGRLPSLRPHDLRPLQSQPSLLRTLLCSTRLCSRVDKLIGQFVRRRL